MTSPAFRDLLASIKKGKDLKPVYILMGEESYYIDTLTEALENNVIEEADRDFNMNVYYGNDADLNVVVAAAQQFPVMSDKKLVMLKEAQSMTQAKMQLEKLAPYVKRPNPTTIFVIAYKGENLNVTSRLLKAATESGSVVFKSEAVKEWMLGQHAKDYCRSKGVSVEDKAMSMLCEYIGSPLSKLFGEINKLIQIKGSDKRITAEDVEKHIGVSKDYNSFELTKAISLKNYPLAVKILTYFKKNSDSSTLFMLNSAIFNFFQKIIICHYLVDKSDQSMMQATGSRQTQLRNIKDGMRSFNARQAVASIHYCREFDAKSKGIGSYQDKYELLYELIFKIFTTP